MYLSKYIWKFIFVFLLSRRFGGAPYQRNKFDSANLTLVQQFVERELHWLNCVESGHLFTNFKCLNIFCLHSKLDKSNHKILTCHICETISSQDRQESRTHSNFLRLFFSTYLILVVCFRVDGEFGRFS